MTIDLEKLKPNTCCHFCGFKYKTDAYPFKCSNCKKTTYRNPLPVVIVAIPVVKMDSKQIGYLGQVRGIDPGKGRVAFASGFVESHETWEDAAIREVKEEFNITIHGVTLERLVSVDGFLCILTKGPMLIDTTIDWSHTNKEVQKIVLIENEEQEMAFSVQKKFLEELPFSLPFLYPPDED